MRPCPNLTDDDFYLEKPESPAETKTPIASLQPLGETRWKDAPIMCASSIRSLLDAIQKGRFGYSPSNYEKLFRHPHAMTVC